MATRAERRYAKVADIDKPKVQFTRKGFSRLISFGRPYWRQLVGAAIAMVIGTVLGLVLPAVAGNLIDIVFVKADRNALNNIALVLVVVFLFQAASVFAQSYLISYAGERVVTDLQKRLYTHLQKLPLGFFNEQRTGDLTSRFTNDVSVVRFAVTGNLISLAQSLITLIGGIAIIILRDWRITLLIVGLIPLLTGIGLFFGSKLKRMANQVQSQLGETTTVLEETISNEKTVKSFTREDYEVGRYNTGIEKVFALAMRRTRLQSSFAALMTFLAFSAIALVLWFGGQQVLDGNLTPGELVSILIYMGIVAGPVGNLTNLFSQFQMAIGGAERIFNLLDEPITVSDVPGAKPLPTVKGHLRFEQVEFEYNEKTPVLHSLGFEALPGQVVALVGPSGAGKTTVANLIPRFFDPKAGRITLDGQDIKLVQTRSLREQIGIVPQEPVLFGTSVGENIGYGRLDATQEEIEIAARAANAHEFIEKLAVGYDTLVGERGVKLSGGQRQRVAIARAILRNPRILILDEATSSLDSESESLVQEALERLMRDRTTIVIAHRLTTIEKADKIVVMEQGRVMEQGTHLELIEAQGLYYRLYTRNFQD